MVAVIDRRLQFRGGRQLRFDCIKVSLEDQHKFFSRCAFVFFQNKPLSTISIFQNKVISVQSTLLFTFQVSKKSKKVLSRLWSISKLQNLVKKSLKIWFQLRTRILDLQMTLSEKMIFILIVTCIVPVWVFLSDEYDCFYIISLSREMDL